MVGVNGRKEIIMILKKVFLSKKQYNMKYDDVNDLKFNVCKICNSFNDKFIVVQVFFKDNKADINDKLLSCSEKRIKIKNFYYYIVKSFEFLYDLCFERLRFMNIYFFSYSFEIDDAFKNKLFNFDILIGFDNYLEITEIITNKYYYNEICDILKKSYI